MMVVHDRFCAAVRHDLREWYDHVTIPFHDAIFANEDLFQNGLLFFLDDYDRFFRIQGFDLMNFTNQRVCHLTDDINEMVTELERRLQPLQLQSNILEAQPGEAHIGEAQQQRDQPVAIGSFIWTDNEDVPSWLLD